MAGRYESYPVIKQYIDELSSFTSHEHAKSWLASIRHSDFERALRAECALLTDFFHSVLKGKVSPPLRESVERLPLVHDTQTFALPASNLAGRLAKQEGARAALVFSSIPNSAARGLRDSLVSLLDFGSYYILLNTIMFCLGSYCLSLVWRWNDTSSAMYLGLVLLGLIYHRSRLAPKAKWAKAVYSTFCLLNVNPPWPIGARCGPQDASKFLETRIWWYHCIADGFKGFRWHLVATFLGIYSLGFAVSPQVVFCYGLTLTVGLSAGFLWRFRGGLEAFLSSIPELEAGLKEMIDTSYHRTWLEALPKEYSEPLTEIMDILAKLRDLGVPMSQLQPEAIAAARFREVTTLA